MNNAFMKRIFSFALLTLFSFLFCISCAGSEVDEVVPEYTVEITEIEYGGADFCFAQRNATYSTGEEYFGFVVETEFADLAMKRINEVEKRYNINVTANTSGQSVSDLVTTNSVAGLVPYDALQAHSSSQTGLARSGYLYDFTLLSDIIDYTDQEKWGIKEELKPMCWDHGLYGVVPAAWPILKYLTMDGVMVVNENYISNLNQTDPRELVERDEWTWRTFEELMPIYNHINDAGDEVVALYTSYHWLFRTIQTTNGEPVIFKDENGEFQLGLHSPITFEAMQTAWNWTWGEYRTYLRIDGSDQITMLNGFLNGTCVLSLMSGTDLCGSEKSVAYNMENFGVVPFPHGPNGTVNNTGSTITTTRFVITIPTLCKDPTMSAVVLNAIYDPLPGYEKEESVIEHLRRQYFFDDRDVTNFVNMYRTELYNYRHEALTDVYISVPGNISVRERLESYSEADEENRQKYVLHIEPTCEELFG